MKIFVIGRAFPEKSTGMIGLFEFQQAKALCDAGNEVHYIYFDSRSIKVNRAIKKIEKTKENVRIHGLTIPLGGVPYPFFYDIKGFLYIFFLKKIISMFGYPDVIHIHFPLLSITPQVWSYIKNIKIKTVVTEHWSAVQKKTIDKSKIEFLKTVFKETDVFITVSQDLKLSVQEICGSTKEIFVIPNMVSDHFSYKGNADHDEFIFVSVGRLVADKGFELLIDAFNREFKNDENIKLVIIGGGKLFNKLNRQVKNLNMSSKIMLQGYMTSDDIANFYKEADCYITASKFETFGLTVAEAWISGLPAIAAKSIGIRNYFSQKNGLLFTPDNIDDLSHIMRLLYEKNDLYDKQRISLWAENLFSSKKIADKLIELYQR